MDDTWNNLKAQDQEVIDEKKNRKRGPRITSNAGPAVTRTKKEKVVKEKSE